MISIKESEMIFGEFEEKNLFRMEDSRLHKSFGSGIRTVEFVLLRQKDQIWFVEAKKSCPNRENRLETKEKTEKFEEFYTEVPEKFSDSLQMFLNIALRRERDIQGVGSALKEKTDYVKTKFLFVLVIKNAKDETWLAGPKAELEERMRRVRKLWGAEVLVLSEALAKEYGLLVE